MTTNDGHPMTTDKPSPLVALVKAMRPKQWTKNLLLFAGLLFTLNDTWKPFSPEMWRNLEHAALAFVVFCLVSSAVYLVNDVVDIEQDRAHPKKKLRPLASGVLSAGLAKFAALVCAGAGLSLGFWLNQNYGFLVASYLLMQAGYTFWWKHVVLVDVFVIAMGFVMRAVGGVLVLGAAISPWFYLVTLLGALFLGLAKRRHEIKVLDGQAHEHRKILGEYSPALLDQALSILASATVMAFSLYTFTAPKLPANHSMMLTIPLVLYGLFRYLYLLHMKDMGGSPEEVLLRDRPIQVTLVLLVVVTVTVLTIGRSVGG